MSPTITTTDELDLEISVAYIALGGARVVWDRSPTGDNARRVADAEAEVNRLLDERLAAER
jgi:hypothetical protein